MPSTGARWCASMERCRKGSGLTIVARGCGAISNGAVHDKARYRTRRGSLAQRDALRRCLFWATLQHPILLMIGAVAPWACKRQRDIADANNAGRNIPSFIDWPPYPLHHDQCAELDRNQANECYAVCWHMVFPPTACAL